MIRFRLDALLANKGWSDYKLAQESGIGADVIGKYRRNEVRRPDLETLNTMCATLGCTTGELLEFVADNPRPSKKARVSAAKRRG